GGDPAPPYHGRVICYIDTGGERVARVDVDFLGGEAPTAVFSPPSRAIADEKRQFGASRRTRWFGHRSR
ncbi:MAG: sulfide:quinone oxidoreductase, partial [Acidimicrobiaceae bacterium]